MRVTRCRKFLSSVVTLRSTDLRRTDPRAAPCVLARGMLLPRASNPRYGTTPAAVAVVDWTRRHSREPKGVKDGAGDATRSPRGVQSYVRLRSSELFTRARARITRRSLARFVRRSCRFEKGAGAQDNRRNADEQSAHSSSVSLSLSRRKPNEKTVRVWIPKPLDLEALRFVPFLSPSLPPCRFPSRGVAGSCARDAVEIVSCTGVRGRFLSPSRETSCG